MTPVNSPSFLRRLLWFDAVTCLVTGTALMVFAHLVERLLAVPFALSLTAGAVLLVFGAAVGYIGSRRDLVRAAVWWIAALNGLWAVGSGLALIAGWLDPNMPGTAFVVIQAVAVAVIAELQIVGLRRTAPSRVASAPSG